MAEQPDQFKRAPRRKQAPVKTVTVSAEAKQAYLDLIKERDRRSDAYDKHLPAGEFKR